MVKYSRQREAIKNQLCGRKDHPTAETLYAELKSDFPNLSVATVYRNLNQLESWGEINKLTMEGATRFDPNTDPHSHFFCRKCGAVQDMSDNLALMELAQSGFGGSIEGCTSNFYGLCESCCKTTGVSKIRKRGVGDNSQKEAGNAYWDTLIKTIK